MLVPSNNFEPTIPLLEATRQTSHTQGHGTHRAMVSFSGWYIKEGRQIRVPSMARLLFKSSKIINKLTLGCKNSHSALFPRSEAARTQ